MHTHTRLSLRLAEECGAGEEGGGGGLRGWERGGGGGDVMFSEYQGRLGRGPVWPRHTAD